MRSLLMKKLISLLFAFLFILSTAAYAAEDVFIYVDGERIEFDVQPQIINDRTMVPMRKIFETLGAEVEWVPEPQMIFATRGAKCALFQIGQYAMAVNDFSTNTVTKTELDTAPLIIDGRTLVPVRAVSEAFGMKVDWDGETASVYIDSKTEE